MKCPNCNHIGKAEQRGSWIIGLGLLLFTFLGGIIYFLWMMCGNIYHCPKCKFKNIIHNFQPNEKQKKRGTN